MTAENDLDHRKLMDWVRPDPDDGNVLGMLATTYELDASFFEKDFLPTFLGEGSWAQSGWANQVAMQRAIARTDAAAVMMDARRFNARPRPLHIEITPAVGPKGAKLHAKVLLVVQEKAIRLLVGSANLTASGYRHNREVGLPIIATARTPRLAAVIHEALDTMPDALKGWWTSSAARVKELAIEILNGWPSTESNNDDRFIWSWSDKPLFEQFVGAWPKERILSVTIVSPFWSDQGTGGPVEQLLKSFGKDQMDGADVHLLTEAAPDKQDTFLPNIPSELASWDAHQVGVNAYAQAVDPYVLPAEVGGRKDYQPIRLLHAKVVVVEGSDTTLAYAGSANFTRHGWGFDHSPANVEAGVMLRCRGKTRDALRFLIPKTTGNSVALNGEGRSKVVVQQRNDDEAAWPTFLASVLLVPTGANRESLELRAALDPAVESKSFSILTVEADAVPLLNEAKLASGALQPQILERLLRDQQVFVRWGKQSAKYPVNVDLEARAFLPISPGSSPGEKLLVAYYQGRIAPEDLYPPPAPDPDDEAEFEASTKAVTTDVDTSAIQSYQIREFVEALQGIRDDLRSASQGTEATMKHAVLGEISPLALARAVTSAALKNQRSPTAAGFQLVEVLACLTDAARFDVSTKRRSSWQACLSRARKEVLSLLAGC